MLIAKRTDGIKGPDIMAEFPDDLELEILKRKWNSAKIEYTMGNTEKYSIERTREELLKEYENVDLTTIKIQGTILVLDKDE